MHSFAASALAYENTAGRAAAMTMWHRSMTPDVAQTGCAQALAPLRGLPSRLSVSESTPLW
jgi:hypothetical protein